MMAILAAYGARYFPGSGSRIKLVPGAQGTSNFNRIAGRGSGGYALSYTNSNNSVGSSNYLGHIEIEAVGVGSWSLAFAAYAPYQFLLTAYIGSAGDTYTFTHGATIAAGNASNTSGLAVLDSIPWDGSRWHWFCLRGNYGVGSGGSTELWVDGIMRVQRVAGDTQPSTGSMTGYRLGLRNSTYVGGDSGVVQVGDIILRNENVIIPDSRVDVLVPTADSLAQWTPSSGTNNYSLVADSGGPIIDQDTYVSASTAGLEDRFITGSLPHTPVSVTAVAVEALAVNTDGTARTLALTLNGDPGPASDPNTKNTYFHAWETNPSGGAVWTKSTAESALAGIKAIT